ANVSIIILKVPSRLVLHLKDLADSIFAPTKSAQIVTAAALIEYNQEVFVATADRLQRDRFVRNRHLRDSKRRAETLIPKRLVGTVTLFSFTPRFERGGGRRMFVRSRFNGFRVGDRSNG